MIHEIGRRAITGNLEEVRMSLAKQELESKLWQAANIPRGQLDAADYKNYIFSLPFLQRLSDRFERRWRTL